MTVFASEPIRSAISELEDDCKFTRAERDAFYTFRDAIQSLPTQPTGIHLGMETTLSTPISAQDTQIETVRQKYKDSVMDISGYCSVYDESLAEHMSAELGRNVASAVCGDNRFTQPIKTLLIANSTKAAKERERYLETLAVERDAVLSYNDQIRTNRTAITNNDLDELRSRQFDNLVNEIEQIESAISTYEQLLENRQQEIHNRDPRSLHDNMKLHLYLYRPLDTDFPVVSTALDKIEELADRKRMIQQSLLEHIYQA